MNIKNLMMWGIIVLLVVGLFQLFQNPNKTQSISKVPFSSFLKKLTQSPSKFIATMLLGNNIALVVYGLFSGKLILDLFFPYLDSSESLDFIYIFYQILLSAFVILITAAFLPNNPQLVPTCSKEKVKGAPTNLIKNNAVSVQT